MKKTLTVMMFLALISVVSMPARAATLEIASLDVSGGLFSMAGVFEGDNAIAFGPFTLEMGTYQGTRSDPLVYFDFGYFGPSGAFTAESCYSTDFDCGSDEPYAPNPPPSGTVDDVAGTISLDLTSWYWIYCGCTGSWSGNQAYGSYDPISGAFTADWSQQVSGGPFNGLTISWQLSGTVNTVPVPPALWLLVSGILPMFLSTARRRRCDDATV